MAHLEWLNDAGHVVAVRFDAVRTVDHRQNASVTKHPVETGADIADHVKVDLPGVSVTGYVSRAPLTSRAKIGGTEASGSYQGITLPSSPVPVAATWVKKQVELPGPPPGAPSKGVLGTIAQGGIVGGGLDLIKGALGGATKADALVRGPGSRSSPNKVESLVTDDPNSRVYLMTSILQEAQRARRFVRFVDEAATYEEMVIASVQVTRTQRDYGATFQLELEQLQTVASKTVAAPQPREVRGLPAQAVGSAAAKAGANASVDDKKKQDALNKSILAGGWDGLGGALRGAVGL